MSADRASVAVRGLAGPLCTSLWFHSQSEWSCALQSTQGHSNWGEEGNPLPHIAIGSDSSNLCVTMSEQSCKASLCSSLTPLEIGACCTLEISHVIQTNNPRIVRFGFSSQFRDCQWRWHSNSVNCKRKQTLAA